MCEGLGQLEAYADVEEGVAFQMDNDLYWNSKGWAYQWAIHITAEKRQASKFCVTRLSSGKVLLQNSEGMYLAAQEEDTDPKTFPVHAVLRSAHAALLFDVFHRGNRVAFRASNGLFLARIRGAVDTLEAAKLIADDDCYFRPVIGDVVPPTFEVLRVIPNDLSGVKCHRHLLEEQTYINRSEVPVRHVFAMTWHTQSTDRIVWNRLWGLGLPSSFPFMVEDTTLTLRYTQDNDQVVSVERHISERQRKAVEVPPKTRATAYLWVHLDNDAAFPFTTILGKVKADGRTVELQEDGAWKGLVFYGLQVEVRMKRFYEPCTAM